MHAVRRQLRRVEALAFWAGGAVLIHSYFPYWSVAIGGAVLGAGWTFMRWLPQKNSRSAAAVRS